MKDFTNYSLLPYNTFGMDVKAARFVEYESVDELQCFLNGRQEKDAPLLHVGRGSNLLFVSDYSGTVLHSGIKGMQVVQETEDFVDLRVGAGEVWDDLVDYTVQKGWYGAENLSLIPGEVGASAVQNIGAYGVEAKDLIVAVETVSVATGELRVFTNEECRYAYRESIFKQELKGKYIVTYVTYRLKNIRCIIWIMGTSVPNWKKKAGYFLWPFSDESSYVSGRPSFPTRKNRECRQLLYESHCVGGTVRSLV